MKSSSSLSARKALVVAGTLFLLTFSTVIFLNDFYVVPILMYHSIDENAGKTKLSVSPESFDKQMKHLRRYRYNVVPLSDIATALKHKGRLPSKTIAITFDDGYENNYLYAYPVLKKYNIPATFFVIVEKIGTPGYMTWDELREISSSGIVAIGSHTKTHRWLTTLQGDDLRDELAGSRVVLEKNIGKQVDLFCYPRGIFDKTVKTGVEAAGYVCAVGTNTGRMGDKNDPFALKRIKISRTSDSPLDFWFKTSGFYTKIKDHEGGNR